MSESTYSNKMAAAEAVVGNDEKWNAFREKLIEDGGTTDAALKKCSWEDLQGYGLPKLVARQVADIFRAEENKPADQPKIVVISDVRAKSMPLKNLVEAYDPLDGTNPVANEIKRRASEQPCIVFNPDGTVNVGATVTVIDEIRMGFPARTSFKIGTRSVAIYPVGKRPGMMADENPLYPGRALRPDDTCDQTNRSWKGVPSEARVMARLALQTGEIKIMQIDDAHRVLDLCVQPDAVNVLHGRFPQASMLYQDLEGKGTLPKLKVELNGNGHGNAGNDAFLGAKRY